MIKVNVSDVPGMTELVQSLQDTEDQAHRDAEALETTVTAKFDGIWADIYTTLRTGGVIGTDVTHESHVISINKDTDELLIETNDEKAKRDMKRFGNARVASIAKALGLELN